MHRMSSKSFVSSNTCRAWFRRPMLAEPMEKLRMGKGRGGECRANDGGTSRVEIRGNRRSPQVGSLGDEGVACKALLDGGDIRHEGEIQRQGGVIIGGDGRGGVRITVAVGSGEGTVLCHPVVHALVVSSRWGL